MAEDRERGRLYRLVPKFGTVASAAAALLVDSASGTQGGDVLAGVSDRNITPPAVSRPADETDGPFPLPLVLKPGNAHGKILLAGHKSNTAASRRPTSRT